MQEGAVEEEGELAGMGAVDDHLGVPLILVGIRVRRGNDELVAGRVENQHAVGALLTGSDRCSGSGDGRIAGTVGAEAVVA